jgi:hypothetical protein
MLKFVIFPVSRLALKEKELTVTRETAEKKSDARAMEEQRRMLAEKERWVDKCSKSA